MTKEEDATIAREVMYWVRWVGLGVFLIGGLTLVGCPYYNVFEQHMAGKAMMAKSQYSKQVLVQEAMAKQEAAKSLAQAEITRAEGVAKANAIIGESLQGNEAYLHYLWIHNLAESNNEVIYIPTETGLPIFEAGGRFLRKPKQAKVADGERAALDARPADPPR